MIGSRWFLALGAVLAMATPAAAQVDALPELERALVTDFTGWRATRVHDAVVDALAAEVALIDADAIAMTADTLGVDATTPEGMAAVGAELDVHYLVSGRVDGRHRRAVSVVIVHDAAGEEIARREGPSPRRDSALGDIGALAVEALLEGKMVLEQRSRPPRTDPRPTVDGEPWRFTDDEPPPPPPWVLPRLEVRGGLRFRNVQTRVNEASGFTVPFGTGLFGELAVEALYRPLAQDEGALSGLRFGLEAGVSIGTRYRTPANQSRRLRARRVHVDAGYEATLSPTVALSAGLGFGLDGVELAGAEGFPSTTFLHLRPGAAVRVRLIEDLLHAELGAGARIGLDGGGIAAAYGPGLFFAGVVAPGALLGVVDGGFSWAVRASLRYYGLDFSGDGGPYGRGLGGEDLVADLRLMVGYTLP